ncbi:MAG TPA: Holliday junction branch migration protein RuvA [Tenericutes bacterium]|nr:Holliday junction branch migration protein RuvA [Mycoplasmatota bacterium]
MVTDITTSYIVLENNNIGYLIYTANPLSFEVNNEYKIYIYQHIREDENLLYGFKIKEEKQLFLRLIQVKGLGCKMALPMFATGGVNGIIDAIERENIIYLKKFPKIGDKIARQIILDLKGKLVSNADTKNDMSEFSELSEALTSLGYKSNDIKKILPKINKDLSVEQQIKEALKQMFK